MITLDRVSKGIDQCEFRYYAQRAGELIEIAPSQFPGAVAGQNMGFDNRFFGGRDRQRDAIQIAKDLDANDPYFRSSLTAYIWNHLATGQQYWESLKEHSISQPLLEGFLRANMPVRLTSITPDSRAVP